MSAQAERKTRFAHGEDELKEDEATNLLLSEKDLREALSAAHSRRPSTLFGLEMSFDGSKLITMNYRDLNPALTVRSLIRVH